MKKQVKTFISLFLVLMITISVFSLTINAELPTDCVKITKHDSYNKDGRFWMSFTFENLNKSNEDIMIDTYIYNSSGNVIWEYNTLWVSAGSRETKNYGCNFSILPLGTYTLQLEISSENSDTSQIRNYNIKHTTPKPFVSYKDYEPYYNQYGMLIHKISINCKNMKGEKLYFQIYNEFDELVCDLGNNTKKIEFNNTAKSYSWNGTTDINGTLLTQPSGYYTIVIKNSSGEILIENTQWFEIPQN